MARSTRWVVLSGLLGMALTAAGCGEPKPAAKPAEGSGTEQPAEHPAEHPGDHPKDPAEHPK